MKRPPRKSDESLVDSELLIRIAFVALLLTLSTTGLFFLAKMNGASTELARTIAVNTLIWGEIVYLFNARVMTSSLSLKGIAATPYVWTGVTIIALVQIPFTYLPAMQSIFRTESMSLSDWGLILAVNLLIFFIVEAEKSVWSRFKK